jgi:hypothetical protein
MADATTSLTVKTDERTFKNLGDAILMIVAISDQDRMRRSALINSARTFIEIRIQAEGLEPSYSYRPLEYYMTDLEQTQPYAELDQWRLKKWLQWNLDIFERKSKGGIIT